MIDSAEAREQERAASVTVAAERPPVPSKNGSGSTASASAHTPTTPEVQMITDEDYEAENPNEIVVGTNTDLEMHIARACNMLMDDSVLFIIIRTRKAEAAQRALQVSLGVTRFRHRQGLKELHQYVVEEEPERKGPRVINLDDSRPGWTPPPNLAIYLSTIDLPDLKPENRKKAQQQQQQQRNGSSSASSVTSGRTGSFGGGAPAPNGNRPPPNAIRPPPNGTRPAVSPPVPPHSGSMGYGQGSAVPSIPPRPQGSGSGSDSGSGKLGKMFKPNWRS